ncbi:DUF29 family protein [Limnofasciculus baicalensis]|uniref:DUF29 domain-containing protein n=1 Tax=Limnofasciculus baicalensis BBK-W-15 TaxID=2699891 RepID=A0AAE3GP53_9CYAN|nr:DUF29 family protein [Limnofasciculus baicalensis]MCP2728140.1 hypothetical protein [Limnofasciculus baicalensis BBK-W-15]
MTQELVELRSSILEGRYDDALAILDELDGMSKKSILLNIQSFLSRLLIHLIKNQVEQRLTNSWAASISDSIRKIQNLNLKENKKSYYINIDEWDSLLEDEFDAAIDAASVEVMGGNSTPFQLLDMVNKTEVILTAKKLLNLTYEHSPKTLTGIIRQNLAELPGGNNWFEGRH